MKARVKEEALLMEFVHGLLGSASSTSVRKMLKTGRVKVDGEPVLRGDVIVEPGQSVEVLPTGEATVVRREHVPKLPFRILYEDADLVAVDKPAGLLTMGNAKERDRTAYRLLSGYLKATEGKRVFIIHRLDRDVSGVIVFAKSEAAKRTVQKGWEHARKTYYAAVHGRPKGKSGTVRNWLAENTAMKAYVSEEGKEGAREAVTNWSVVSEQTGYTVLKVEIETGRKHQIRVHMAGLGCPIVGDKVYGVKGQDPALPGLKYGIGLHAARLEFTHPTSGRTLKLRATLPAWAK